MQFCEKEIKTNFLRQEKDEIVANETNLILREGFLFCFEVF